MAKINAIKEEVSQGNLLTVALQNSGHFPPLLVQLSKVGENQVTRGYYARRQKPMSNWWRIPWIQ